MLFIVKSCRNNINKYNLVIKYYQKCICTQSVSIHGMFTAFFWYGNKNIFLQIC